MDFMEQYRLWIKHADAQTKEELLRLEEPDIRERFYRTLEFGTAGLRGIMGAGTNRINRYIVGQATQALANYLRRQENGPEKGAVIAFDCRIHSEEYALEAALILCANGIRTYLFDGMRPTPELSFAIRHLGAMSGINITASHNPKEYNGYKVFWDKGAQILSDIGDELLAEMDRVDLFRDICRMDQTQALEEGLLKIIGKDIDDLFVERIKELVIHHDVDKQIRIVYTPLHGTGMVFIPRILREEGYDQVTVVEEQSIPDGTFPTAPYPNPEDPSVFRLSLEYAARVEADLIMATDPDGDRIAVMVRHPTEKYVFLNGNQLGALLVHYIVEERYRNGTLNPKDVLIKTIVTNDMGRVIAARRGIRTFETLTGFKHICGLYNQLEEKGEYGYLFGYEESIGYCPETFTRDKNAVSTAVLIAEMCAFYRKQGKTPYSVLYELYDFYGHYRETQVSVSYPGAEGKRTKDRVMARWRNLHSETIAGIRVIRKLDYLGHVEDHIEPSNALKFLLEDGSWYAVRPSGTEPKLKIYISTVADSEKKAMNQLGRCRKDMERILQSFNKEENHEYKNTGGG